jgi:hypothetical protein
VRSYAWSAKLPVSILTDFEEFAVYDCRNRPDRSDSAATGRIKLLNYKEYLTRWDEVEGLFSRKAVWAGKLAEWITDSKGKKGTLEVDDAFLQEIEKWRDLLARNIAIRNPNLSVRELNYAVQMTIDRIIFLRICEDRQIEPENCLKDICSGEGIYPELVYLFRQADTRYNSGLFHFNIEKGQSSSPDDLTPALSIDDKVLKDIVSSLYYPSPYVFRVLPADILGQVYERFLGKVIRLTAGHQAKVEEKPEVRKAGGVYYTPTYIVDYIVKNTVGKLLENKTPTQVASLKIVDPACGSGSFLLGAYQYLLDWHTKWYSDNQPEKWSKGKSPAIYQAQGGWRLTTSEKKKILLNNIHGVDIDPQAVEVTKLSLSLKVLEGESQETLNSQMSLFKERALPDLAKNIQCGNSLIGSNYNEGKLFTDEEERLRVNPFDWNVAFPQVFTQGGFDAVIGNPPYIRIQALKEWAPFEVEFYKKQYKAATKGNYDIYVVFVEKGISLLNRKGILGFILPHKFFNAQYGEPLRQIITQGNHIRQIVHFADQQVFENVNTYTCLMFLGKAESEEFLFNKVKDLNKWKSSKKDTFTSIRSSEINWDFSEEIKFGKQYQTLADYSVKIFQGLATSSDSIFVMVYEEEGRKLDKLISHSLNGSEVFIENELLHPLLKGSEISRYQSPIYKNKLLFPYRIIEGQAIAYSEIELRRKFPNGYEYLLQNKAKLLIRSKTNSSNWWLYPYPKNLTLYNKPKILSQVLSTRGNFSLDNEGKFFFLGGGTAGGNGIIEYDENPEELQYLLGILNSSFCTNHVKRVSSGFRGGYFAFGKSSLSSLPIPIKASTSFQNIKHSIIILVNKMISLHKQIPRTSQEKEALQRQIAATDKQIDNLVYQLYGLTPEEIKIVEGS